MGGGPPTTDNHDKHRAIEATVHGRVQGVGFRYYTRKAALSYGVSGYVANMPDGTVRVVCEGSLAAVTRMQRWLHKGPPSAHVTAVDVRELPYRGRYAAFTVEL